MKCPSCGYFPLLHIWKEGDTMFASSMEFGIRAAVRVPFLICARCGAIYTPEGVRVEQDREQEIQAGLNKSLGEDRNRPAIISGGKDDDS